MKIKMETLLTILLIVFVVVSAIQAIQLSALGTRVKSGSFAKTSKGTVSSGGSQIQAPSATLPSMVGGC